MFDAEKIFLPNGSYVNKNNFLLFFKIGLMFCYVSAYPGRSTTGQLDNCHYNTGTLDICMRMFDDEKIFFNKMPAMLTWNSFLCHYNTGTLDICFTKLDVENIILTKWQLYELR